MSLFLMPTRESIDLTSNRPRPPIYSLNDDILLNIFYLHRLHIGDEEATEDVLTIRRWDRQRWWYKLAQVSRGWRCLILSSSSRLDLHLLCTYGVPVADMLAHSPPLPLIVFYHWQATCQDRDPEMTPKDEQGALLAISNRDRVRRIALAMSAPELEKFIPAMDGQFPTLEHLCMESRIRKYTRLMPFFFFVKNSDLFSAC
jgi:hypothetical protein